MSDFVWDGRFMFLSLLWLGYTSGWGLGMRQVRVMDERLDYHDEAYHGRCMQNERLWYYTL